MATTVNGLEQIAGRRVPEFDGLFDIWPRRDRLAQIRAAAEAFKLRFKEQGTVQAVRSVDLATAPYITQYAFHGAVKTPNPYLSMTNRMVVVRYQDFAGQTRTLVWEPTEADASAEAPFYAQMLERSQRNPVFKALENLFYKEYTKPEEALP